MPDPESTPEKMMFAFASCQHYETGLYTAYEHMRNDHPDAVFFLGDYIYEYKGKDGLVRKHHGDEIQTLGDYRARLSQYRSDPLLQGMHAECPWFLTWDDHEFDNNCANDISEEQGVDPIDFLVRRANSYQAYYEMMPLRMNTFPTGPDMRIYRQAKFGKLAEFNILDTRQYRTDQPNNDRASPLNSAAMDKMSSMMGRKQKGWLMSQLVQSQGIWNVLPQQVMMGMVGFAKTVGGDKVYSMDQWPGYTYERMELMKFMAERKVSNPVVLTGDIHVNYVNDLRVDDREMETPVVASEFVVTSISSGGNGKFKPNTHDTILANNPFVKFHTAERGYVKCTLTPETYTSDYIAVEDVTMPGGKAVNRGTFVIEAGKAGIQKG
jgi:alkaline phosphatase D